MIMQGVSAGCGEAVGLCRWHKLALAVAVAAFVDLLIAVVIMMAGQSLARAQRQWLARVEVSLHVVSLASEVVVLVATLLTINSGSSGRSAVWFLVLSFGITLVSFAGNLIGIRKLVRHFKVATQELAARLSSKARKFSRASITEVRVCTQCKFKGESLLVMLFQYGVHLTEDVSARSAQHTSTDSTSVLDRIVLLFDLETAAAPLRPPACCQSESLRLGMSQHKHLAPHRREWPRRLVATLFIALSTLPCRCPSRAQALLRNMHVVASPCLSFYCRLRPPERCHRGLVRCERR
jgi:ABC-type multidrug transport system fused ATPase/permease subunit